MIEGALVKATSGRFVRQVLQGSAGYRIRDLSAGTYWISPTAQGYEPGSYRESVPGAQDQVITGIDFHLVPSSSNLGGIAGFVTSQRNAEPILGALVAATGPSQGHASTCRREGYAIRDCCRAGIWSWPVRLDSSLRLGSQPW
ncbi:MAG: carboxypeptidase-like regulatory domain-containing protein [candidate division WOR-3 bacterium]